MNVSSAQVAALTDARLQEFEERCVALIRTTWRDAFAHLDDDAVRALVKERAEAAGRYGFTGQRDVYRFLNLSCYLGTDFERRPDLEWAVELLRRPGLDLGRKVELIVLRHEGDRALSRRAL